VSEPLAARQQRVERLLAVARRIADPTDPLGQRARFVLPGATGLTPEGVELALTRCLETQPSESELRTLCGSVPSATRAHVLLSSNVFVGAHRAIALALACSHQVEVRCSRREPEMAALLRDGDRGLFRIVDELAPLPGEHVWAYGTHRALAALRDHLVAGVVLHAHGPGIGVAVVQPGPESERDVAEQMQAAASKLAQDVVPFDQRGCLSPRLAFVFGGPEAARDLATALAKELAGLQFTVPRGELSSDEAADVAWYRDTWLCAGELYPAGKGFVGLELEAERVLLPPVGRNVHVVHVTVLERALRPLGPAIVAAGLVGPRELRERLAALLPGARVSGLGAMQHPRFDGPVDRRPGSRGEVL
jgi:hypothetical protein